MAALRRFALVDLEAVPDERDPAVTTDTIRLHRLIRLVAGWRRGGAAVEAIRRGLLAALAAVYPAGTYNDPRQWPRARRLDAIATELLGTGTELPSGLETAIATVLDSLASYRQAALGAYSSARTLVERALALREHALGAEHPDTAASLNNLATLLQATNRLGEAEPLMRRALAIFLAFQRDTGHVHPHRDAVTANYRGLLAAMGKSEAAIDAELAALWREAGLDPG